MVDSGHAGDPVAVGVADDDGMAIAEGGDDLGDIVGEVVQRNPGHRPNACADTARLRAQHAKARDSKPLGDRVVIFRVARQRWKQKNCRSLAFNDDVDRNAVVADDLAGAGGGERAAGHEHARDQQQHRKHGPGWKR
jgi:hypothetical protein